MNLEFKIISFNELSSAELYAILALRQAVFIVEQNCPFLDADGKDLDAYHVLIQDENGELMAYSRLLNRGVAYENYPSIGRVVSSPKARGIGAGIFLMEVSIKACIELYGRQTIKIGAQLYLKKFYESFGFVQIDEPYDEDGIMHIAMILEENEDFDDVKLYDEAKKNDDGERILWNDYLKNRADRN